MTTLPLCKRCYQEEVTNTWSKYCWNCKTEVNREAVKKYNAKKKLERKQRTLYETT